jgi:hypothetical protein
MKRYPITNGWSWKFCGGTAKRKVRDSDETRRARAGPTRRTQPSQATIAKGVAAAERDEHNERLYWYYATVSKEDYIASQTKGHLQRYYSGRLPQLVAGLLEDESVSDRELGELEAILKRYARKEE